MEMNMETIIDFIRCLEASLTKYMSVSASFGGTRWASFRIRTFFQADVNSPEPFEKTCQSKLAQQLIPEPPTVCRTLAFWAIFWCFGLPTFGVQVQKKTSSPCNPDCTASIGGPHIDPGTFSGLPKKE